jgi:acetyl esterase/lipase
MAELLDLRTGWAFLLLSLWNGAFTFNAYHPLRRPAPASIAAFFAGWLTCELALHHVVWQVALGAVFVYEGALEHAPGVVALVISAGSWAALLRLHFRGHAAQAIADGALEEAFARLSARPDAVDLGVIEAKRPVRVRDIARPFSMKHREVVRIRDLVYAEADDRALRVDVYHRRDTPSNAPVLLFVHGGAWILGFKEYQALPMLHRMAAQGWVCMSVDYRLSPRASFPDHVVDVKRAIAWAKARAADFGGDPGFLALSGNSAGAHLASLAALTWDDPSYQPGFSDADTRVDACVSFYGVYDFTDSLGAWPSGWLLPFLEQVVLKKKRADDPEAFRSASPLFRVRSDAPPFLVVHGEKDSLVPVAEGRAFSAALREVSEAPVVYVEVPDAQHAFEIFRSVRGHHTLRAVQHFLNAVHRRAHPAATEVATELIAASGRSAEDAPA